MILVTGGTGLVGSHLLYNLMQKCSSVRAIHRKSSDLKNVQKVFSYYTDAAQKLFDKIEWVEADITDIPALESVFKDIDYVYHCAALISFDPKDYNKLRNINTKGTANIVNLCLAQNIKKLGYISSIAAIGKKEGTPLIDEEAEWNDENASGYSLTKYAAELEVWRGTQEGLDAVIINPGFILGPGFWKEGSGLFFSQAAKGLRYCPPSGSGFVSVTDVVKMIVNLMESTIVNENFIAVGENQSFKEILSKIAQSLGKPIPKKELKRRHLYLLFYFDWIRKLLTGKKPRVTKNSLHSLNHFYKYDTRKIREQLNFKFEDLEDTIAFTSARFLEEKS